MSMFETMQGCCILEEDPRLKQKMKTFPLSSLLCWIQNNSAKAQETKWTFILDFQWFSEKSIQQKKKKKIK